MRYVKRFIAVFALSAILLCIPLFFVSAAGSLNDWFSTGPYYIDFLSPAGENSVVYDLVDSNGFYKRRYVFPDSAYDVNILVNDSTGYVTLTGTTRNSGDVIYMYYDYDSVTGSFNPDKYALIEAVPFDDHYALQVNYSTTSPLVLGGCVTNSSIVFASTPWKEKILVKAFPNSDVMEHEKTQGMISQLIQDIKDWFSNLIDSMGNFFTELANKISGFFTELGDKIGGFFTTLWNKIWWGNEAGESEYDPPDVGSKFDDVITSLNDWLSQLKGFSDTVNSQGDEVAGYISTGSDAVTKFLTYAPAPILIFLTFAIVFVVVRKVVGR